MIAANVTKILLSITQQDYYAPVVRVCTTLSAYMWTT